MTESIREDRNRLFLPIKGNHDINKDSISGWISSVISSQKFVKEKVSFLNIRAHEVRALATSLAYFSKAPLEEVVRAAGLSNQSIFAKSCLRSS